MEAELGFDEVAHLAFFQAKRPIFERLNHRATVEIAQIATLLGRAGVLRTGFGQLSKAARVGFKAGQQGFCFDFDLGTLGGFLRGSQQNMGDAAAFFGKVCGVGGVILGGFLVCHLDVSGQLVLRQHQIVQLDPFWRLKAFGVGFVVSLNGGIVNFDFAGKLGGGQGDVADLAGFGQKLVKHRGLLAAHQCAAGNAGQLLFNQHVFANQPFKSFGIQPLLRQKGLIAFGAEFAVLLHIGNGSNGGA